MKSSIREIGENIKNGTLPFSFRGNVAFDELMADHTTMKTGGPAKVFVQPEDKTSLVNLARYARKEECPLFILGGGSNLICSDSGMEALVLSTESISFIEKTEEGKLRLGSGTKMDSLYKWCQENGWTGLETFAGLPGTIGGACFMNARCYEKEISEFLSKIEYLDLDSLEIKVYEKKDSDWSYKKSPFQKIKSLILSVELEGCTLLEKSPEGKKLSLEEACNAVFEKNRHYIEDRISKGHFRFPSAGSVFKNDRKIGKPSGKLIDEAGLKGFSLGDAQIAPWHGNIIINRGKAKASDIKSLVDLVQAKVKERTGFLLESEVIFC